MGMLHSRVGELAVALAAAIDEPESRELIRRRADRPRLSRRSR